MPISDTLALTGRSLKKWIRNPATIMPALFISVFWLALFGSSFNPTNLIPSQVAGYTLIPATISAIKSQMLTQSFGGAPDYITYLVAGIVALVIITSLAFGGIDIVLDRQLGFLNQLLVAPISRSSIYFAGVWQNFVKAMVVGLLTFLIGLILPNGVQLGAGFSVLSLGGVFVVFGLIAFGLCSAFTAIAFSVKSIDSAVAIGNFLLFPLIFVSGAIFPSSSFPDWLKYPAEVNPVSKAAEAARLLIVNGNLSASQLSVFEGDLAYLLVFVLLITLLGLYVARRALAPR